MCFIFKILICRWVCADEMAAHNPQNLIKIRRGRRPRRPEKINKFCEIIFCYLQYNSHIFWFKIVCLSRVVEDVDPYNFIYSTHRQTPIYLHQHNTKSHRNFPMAFVLFIIIIFLFLSKRDTSQGRRVGSL
jgi:hypothetical protein